MCIHPSAHSVPQHVLTDSRPQREQNQFIQRAVVNDSALVSVPWLEGLRFEDFLGIREMAEPGIGQNPILQAEGGPSLDEKALDRNIIQHSSKVLARESREGSTRLQEDGAQAQADNFGARMDTEDAGSYCLV